MGLDQITVRAARKSDAPAVAAVHDRAWRSAYRGIIPGVALERMIERRGTAWWSSLIAQKHGVLVLDVHDSVAGYVTLGRNRTRTLRVRGEVYELYLDPPYQGLGFGSLVFDAARSRLEQAGMTDFVVWVLEANKPAVSFYKAMGGEAVAHGVEQFVRGHRLRQPGTDLLAEQGSCRKLAYVWGKR